MLILIGVMARIPDEQIRAEAKLGIEAAKEFFAKNPGKIACSAGAWYDKIITIRRGHEEEDMNRAAEEAINKFKQ